VTFECWGVLEKGKEFVKWNYKPRALGNNDVEIKIVCCGICASDIHQVDNGWGGTSFPIVPGHEIVGHVVAKGTGVTRFNIGDRVGVGAQCCSCLSCDECDKHEESYCNDRVWTYNGNYTTGEKSYGGYAKSVRVHEEFAIMILEKFDSFQVAPLLCAGITTYDPLVRYNVRGKKLGVLGVGGLGHLGVKFGVALGNEVVGISRNPDKRDEVLALGAKDYISTKNEDQLKKYMGYFDFILCTIDTIGQDEIQKYLGLLKTHGTINLVGVPDGTFTMPVHQCVFKNKSITGTAIGSPSKIEEMLKFCSENNIVADVQVFPIEKVNEAYVAFREGKPRYRFVLQIDNK